MKRRQFLRHLGLTTAALAVPAAMRSLTLLQSQPTHLVTLSFDDGFKKSNLEAARVHEKYGLSACFNVIASAHLPEFEPPDDFIKKPQMGDFETWNALKAKGHEVMVHSWAHRNLARAPLNEAKALVDRSLEYFEGHLRDFRRKDAIFNFPFNASTPELETYVLSQVRAIRTGGTGSANPFPSPGMKKLSCVIYGRPGNGDSWLEKQMRTFLQSDGGWLVVNLHGLDGEGWAPISSSYLALLLERLLEEENVAVLNVSQALDRFA